MRQVGREAVVVRVDRGGADADHVGDPPDAEAAEPGLFLWQRASRSISKSVFDPQKSDNSLLDLRYEICRKVSIA